LCPSHLREARTRITEYVTLQTGRLRLVVTDM